MVIYTPFNKPYEIRLPGFGDDAPRSGGGDDPYGFSRTLLRGHSGSTSQRMDSLRLDQRINQHVQMRERSEQERLNTFYDGISQRHERVVQYDNSTLEIITNRENGALGKEEADPELTQADNSMTSLRVVPPLENTDHMVFSGDTLQSGTDLWNEMATEEEYGITLVSINGEASSSQSLPYFENLDTLLLGNSFQPDLWDDISYLDIAPRDYGTVEYDFSTERRGRSSERLGIFSRARSTSPTRLKDTYYEEGTDWFTTKVKKCYEAKENLTIENFDPNDILPALGAVSVDGIILVNDGLDWLTFDSWSTVTGLIDDVAHDAQTYVRRGTRFVSDDQRSSQNLGDGVYVVLSVFGGKGLKSIKAFKKAGDVVKNLSRVKKINNRMPRNHEWAGKLFPLERISRELQQKYPHGVHFTGMGYPDFTRYAKAKVNIKVTGDHYLDKKLANAKAGFKKTPDGYTWHHHQNGITMQLIPYDLHKAISHTGGFAKITGLK